MTKRYVVQTFGCQMNEHDSERIAGLLESDGMVRAESVEDADVIVLNTCCIRENADNKLYGQLGQLKRLKDANPDLQIAVGGCLAQKDRDTVRQRAGHVDVVFGTHNVARAAELLHEAAAKGPIVEILEAAVADDAADFPSALPARREVDHAAWLTIQIGCDNSCAFCIVPAVRGPELSRPFADLISEAEQVVADGAVEITLLGQNVNSYGRDLTTSLRSRASSPDDVRLAGAVWFSDERRRPRPLFADLLRTIGAIPELRRLRYTSPHPKDLREDVLAAMAEVPAVCEHLHFPLQSGSDTVLAAMHRGYTAERYLERLQMARAMVPDLAVTTDIIVGFPGETDVDFERTLEVAAEAEYDSAYTFVFSPREGTEAAAMVERYCDPDVVNERYERLRSVVARAGLRRHEARVGRVEEVIVEGPSKRDPAITTGRTRQNKLVHFPAPSPLRIGTVAAVEVCEARTHYLLGRLVEVVAGPRHRTRIPVVAG